MGKICNKCKKEKDVLEYHKDKNKSLGCANICKSCRTETHLLNRERELQRMHDWYIKNKRKKEEYDKNYKEKNKEVMIQRRRDKYLCKSTDPNFKQICRKNYEKYRQNQLLAAKKRHTELRQEVFSYYGIICCWCGEDDFYCLEIDHINNDGSEDRKKNLYLYKWLKDKDFPEGFQTLCAGCNQAKNKNHGQLPENRKNKYSSLH